MAMGGEWISVQSAREQAERQLQVEADELAALPEEEAEELTLIYQAKGLPEDRARGLATRLLADDEQALTVLANEELGIDPNDLGGSPWSAAITSFLLFAVGAIVPLLPYLFLAGAAGVIASITASGLALIALGAVITVFTGHSAWRSGLRQLTIGLAAAGLTYGLGTLLGVSLAG
jgi:VIT1/CCC1 family predicted Fe2+/Mn2+ transporter